MSVWGKSNLVTKVSKPSRPAAASAGSSAPVSSALELHGDMSIFKDVPRVETIHLEGLVLLQIIKHCHEHLPSCVAGSLLGLENQTTLEVTNSFPSPPSDFDGNADEYQIEMMKNLREVNVDNNKVGWYQTAIFGEFNSATIINAQFQHQDSLGPNAVCVIYDPTQTVNGQLNIRAFRLTSKFCDLFKAGEYTKESLSKLDITSSKIMEEIKIQIHNPEIVQCWLLDFQKEQSPEDSAFDRLDLSVNPFLESSLQNLNTWSDELAQEHNKYQGYERALGKQKSAQQQWLQKRREENKIRRENGQPLLSEENPTVFKKLSQPSRLEGLLITKQIQTYCDQVNRFAGKSFPKLFLAGAIHKE